jgi:hypothetical protein
MSEFNIDDRWQDEWMAVVCQTALSLAELSKLNPWPNISLLAEVMKYLMTELWDRGFSQTEIAEAFNGALDDLPRYTAGMERSS